MRNQNESVQGTQNKKTAIAMLVCIILLLLASVLSYVLGIKAQELIRFGKSPFVLAVATNVVSIFAIILTALSLYFGSKMLRVINGKGAVYYIFICMYLIFLSLMLVLSISGMRITIPLL